MFSELIVDTVTQFCTQSQIFASFSGLFVDFHYSASAMTFFLLVSRDISFWGVQLLKILNVRKIEFLNLRNWTKETRILEFLPFGYRFWDFDM